MCDVGDRDAEFRGDIRADDFRRKGPGSLQLADFSVDQVGASLSGHGIAGRSGADVDIRRQQLADELGGEPIGVEEQQDADRVPGRHGDQLQLEARGDVVGDEDLNVQAACSGGVDGIGIIWKTTSSGRRLVSCRVSGSICIGMAWWTNASITVAWVARGVRGETRPRPQPGRLRHPP
jgi:hypothetical protein